jgi:hypothetical protein
LLIRIVLRIRRRGRGLNIVIAAISTVSAVIVSAAVVVTLGDC